MENKNNDIEQQNLIIDEEYIDIFSTPSLFPGQEISFNPRLIEIFDRHFNQDDMPSK